MTIKPKLIKDLTVDIDLDTSELDALELDPEEVVTPKAPRRKVAAPKVKRNTLRARKRRAATPEEKKAIEIKHTITRAKQTLTKSTNKLKEILEEKPEIKDTLSNLNGSESVAETILKEEEDTRIRILPNPGPQTNFLAADEDQVFYGGSKGGGKSYGLVLDPLRYIDHPRFTGILIRRTIPELQDIISQQQVIYKAADPGARFFKSERLWVFSSGARLFLGYGETAEELERYRGQSYQWLGIDELPQYPTSKEFDLMASCVRSPYEDLPTRIRCTGNPGNVGSAWVKERFIDPAPAGKAFKVDVSYMNPLTKEKVEAKITRRFIPATVWDNPYLTNDPTYVATLASLPELMRRQMLEGDWDVAEGMAFPEFNRNIHVCEPFDIPYEWVRLRGADWGFNAPACCLWGAFDEDGTCYIYREMYGSGTLADKWAENVMLAEQEEAVLINYGVIDRSIAARRGDVGPTIYETIHKTTQRMGGAVWRLADQSPNSRKQRKIELHHRLATRPTGNKNQQEVVIKPRLVIFNTCTNLIRTLPLLPTDKNNVEDIDTHSEDHAYDALTYMLMSRPLSVEQNRKNKFFMQVPNDFTPTDPVFGY